MAEQNASKSNINVSVKNNNRKSFAEWIGKPKKLELAPEVKIKPIELPAQII